METNYDLLATLFLIILTINNPHSIVTFTVNKFSLHNLHFIKMTV